MAKSLRKYREEIRELRIAGFNVPASRGYRLSGPLSPGIKSTVTRLHNQLEALDDRFADEPDFDDELPPSALFFEETVDFDFDDDVLNAFDFDEPFDEFADDFDEIDQHSYGDDEL